VNVGRIESINISHGGVPKTPVFETLITEHGLAGDKQRHLQFHGGPDRAVVIFSRELIQALQAEGHPIGIGTIGENLTVSGLSWSSVAPGTELRIGDARLIVTAYATPCDAIRHSFIDGNFTRVLQKARPGWSRVCTRVIGESIVRIGDPIEHRGEP
jgi:MOSC domain-containing protein YiiM